MGKYKIKTSFKSNRDHILYRFNQGSTLASIGHMKFIQIRVSFSPADKKGEIASIGMTTYLVMEYDRFVKHASLNVGSGIFGHDVISGLSKCIIYFTHVQQYLKKFYMI